MFYKKEGRKEAMCFYKEDGREKATCCIKRKVERKPCVL